MVVLLLLVTGVDTALDRVASAPEQASFVYYNGRCRPVYAYNGNLAFCKIYNHTLITRIGVAPRA
jgi:hypothetical protein